MCTAFLPGLYSAGDLTQLHAYKAGALHLQPYITLLIDFSPEYTEQLVSPHQ